MRLSALQASWRRDRWVAKRRIALRWLAWLGWRYGLPSLGTLTLLVIAWRVVLAWPLGASPGAMAVPDAAPVHAPVSPATAQNEPPMMLRFDPAVTRPPL